MVKWIVSFLLSVLLAGCSSSQNCCQGSCGSSSGKIPGKIQVLSTTAMIGDLVDQIGAPFIENTVLISGELDPHSYELVKGDDEKLFAAQIVFVSGLGLEHGASLRYWVEKHPFAVAIGDEIRNQRPDLILTPGGELDPHVWMDISLWKLGVSSIVEALVKLDPEHAEHYQEKGKTLEKQMQETHDNIRAQLHQVPEKQRFLVTSHDAFNYFTRSYLAENAEENWQERCAAPEGLSPDGQLSVTDIQRIIEHLCTYQIKVVFPESNLSRDSLRKIVSSCKEKGLSVKISSEVLYGDAMGPQGSDADSYLKMMEHNAVVMLRDWSTP